MAGRPQLRVIDLSDGVESRVGDARYRYSARYVLWEALLGKQALLEGARKELANAAGTGLFAREGQTHREGRSGEDEPGNLLRAREVDGRDGWRPAREAHHMERVEDG